MVILGQDSYHGKGQANGLCFSVDQEIKNPPSLRNILKELNDDLQIERSNSNFIQLSKQVVLFLNCTLTVREKTPMSHAKKWKPITDYIIEYI